MQFVYEPSLKRKVLKGLGGQGSSKFPEIGHSIRKSTTFYPEVYHLGNLINCDASPNFTWNPSNQFQLPMNPANTTQVQ